MVAKLSVEWGLAFLLVIFTGMAFAGSGPRLTVAQPLGDSGEVMAGVPARLAFKLANCGSAPLKVIKVGHTAGCFVEDYVKQIAPGQTGFIHGGLATTGLKGRIEGTFYVYTNDPEAMRYPLKATATVIPLITVELDRIYFSGFSDKAYHTTITIHSNSSRPLEIKSTACSVENRLRYRLEPLRAGKTYRLDVHAQPPPGSYFRGRFILETNYAAVPQIIIPVMGRILRDVDVMPTTIDFGIRFKKDYVKPSPQEKVRLKDWRQNWHNLPANLILRVNRGKDVHITDIVMESSYFKKEKKIVREGRVYRLVVWPLIDQRAAGEY
ncbi:MAG: DUF1573 domain-containing protein, partial [Desulfosarcina sp.]|nr:DUF1573 domain-containing protein [Desulfobacterales bacterium]